MVDVFQAFVDETVLVVALLHTIESKESLEISNLSVSLHIVATPTRSTLIPAGELNFFNSFKANPFDGSLSL